MTSALKKTLIAQYIRRADPDEMLEVANETLPIIIRSMEPRQRAAFFEMLMRDHLPAILDGLSNADRAALLESMLPVLISEFPLQDVDLLSVFG